MKDMTKEQAYKNLEEHRMKRVTIECCIKENGKILTGIMGMQYNILEQDMPIVMKIAESFSKEVHKLDYKMMILDNPFPNTDNL